MQFSIPIYVEVRRSNRGEDEYSIRPLFLYEGPIRKGARLSRALQRLSVDVRKGIRECAQMRRQDALAQWSFCPQIDDEVFETRVVIKRATHDVRLLLISFQALDRRVAMFPALEGSWFMVDRGEDLRESAAKVVTSYYRDRTKNEEEVFDPVAFNLNGEARVSLLDLDVDIPMDLPKEKLNAFSLTEEGEKMSGAQELSRTGRELNSLYPQDLNRAILREKEVESLSQSLLSEDRRPVLILGRPKCGKTAVIHETLFRNLQAEKGEGGKKMWLLSPQRLVSGMMYVGQWEERLLSIIDEAEAKDHILYFDDLVGLFLAGVSAQSDLSMGHVLKPHLEKRRIRLLGEISPEAFRVLQERDRAFADMFHVIRVEEPDEVTNTRILIEVQRQIEGTQRCRFGLDVLKQVLDIKRRYAKEQAFPGKAADFLHRLGMKFPGGKITRDKALEEFRASSGLSLDFVDSERRMALPQVLRRLSSQVIGQDKAVQALAEIITLSRARLNDPGRPFGSLLFLGPTGVGKTETAKAAAAFLFGSEERLVRFDMNEFSEWGAAARLVGTIGEPEGQLTSAIRRQPFCVLLLDEIEKAHPEVFDMLLSVLGEGRLTDALGRTADFTNCIIVMTSNLGVREAGQQMGFFTDDLGDASFYVSAAEKFFRPEFFNRLDRIAPFDGLAKEQLQVIAHRLIQDLFRREGLRQRKCALEISHGAVDRLVERGYQPRLGARALKRVVEQEIAHPLARRLSESPGGAPTVIELQERNGKIEANAQVLELATRKVALPDLIEERSAREIVDLADMAWRRLKTKLQSRAPQGAVSLDKVSPEEEHYFTCGEQLTRTRRILDTLFDVLDSGRQWKWPTRGPRMRVFRKRRSGASPFPVWDVNQLLSVERLKRGLEELEDDQDQEAGLENQLALMVRELAFLDSMVGTEVDSQTLWFDPRIAGDPTFYVTFLLPLQFRMFDFFWGVKAKIYHAGRWITEEVDQTMLDIALGLKPGERLPVLVLEGVAARLLGEIESGVHLAFSTNGEMEVIQLEARLFIDETELETVIKGSAENDDELHWGNEVIRIYHNDGPSSDLRTGAVVGEGLDGDTLRELVLSLLDAPEEFKQS